MDRGVELRIIKVELAMKKKTEKIMKGVRNTEKREKERIWNRKQEYENVQSIVVVTE